MRSFQFVVIGYAIEDISNNIGGNIAPNVFYWTLLFLSITIGGWVLLDLGAKILRIVLAQCLEEETRKEFYKSLLGKSQSFHDKQAIGDIMARATNDVRFLNTLISPGIANLIGGVLIITVPLATIFIVFPDLPQLSIIPIVFITLFL